MQKDDLIEIVNSEEDLLELLVPFIECEPPFADTAGDRCLSRGLLPAHLLDCLSVLNFLSVTVVSAQKAQRKYGIRASVLLSMAMHEVGFDPRRLTRDHLVFSEQGGARIISRDIDRWFSKKAKLLATTKTLRKALPCTSVEGYIKHVCELGFGGWLVAEDLWANVENYHLQDCDCAGMLPIGKFARFEYNPVHDTLGRLTGVAPDPFMAQIREMLKSQEAA